MIARIIGQNNFRILKKFENMLKVRIFIFVDNNYLKNNHNSLDFKNLYQHVML